MWISRLAACLIGLTVAGLATSAASAHPHVWISVKAEAMLGPDGKLVAIRHHWTFDDMYSAFVTENLGKDGEAPTPADLEPVAKTNVESLKEFDYFTFAKLNGRKVAFNPPKDWSMSYDAKSEEATLHFTLPLARPADTKKPFSFLVYDPSYFVAFGFEKGQSANVEGGPQGCSATILRPAALDDKDQAQLDAAKIENFSPGEDFSIRLADRAVVSCP